MHIEINKNEYHVFIYCRYRYFISIGHERNVVMESHFAFILLDDCRMCIDSEKEREAPQKKTDNNNKVISNVTQYYYCS
jgi:hypothetical protein